MTTRKTGRVTSRRGAARINWPAQSSIQYADTCEIIYAARLDNLNSSEQRSFYDVRALYAELTRLLLLPCELRFLAGCRKGD